MEFNLKTILIGGALLLGLAFGTYKVFFAAPCCSSAASCTATAAATTSGCTPSNCRGAKTKFGEAKVISELRLNLIDLKAEMEQSKSPAFEARSYDIHGIVGETDDESLDILVKEVKIVEAAIAEKLNQPTSDFVLPENKAKQISYLNARIEVLQDLL